MRIRNNRYYISIVQRLQRHQASLALLRLFATDLQVEKWIFVLGCYNSGTTLLASLIAAHPDVTGLPREGASLSPELARPEDFGWTRMWAACENRVGLPADRDENRTRRLRKDWSLFVEKPRNAFVEKSIANVPKIGWLQANFPNAHFLSIIREPVATCCGILTKAKPKGLARDALGADAYPPDMAVNQWIVANRRIAEAAPILPRYMGVRYEDLAERPFQTLETIFRFLNLSTDRCVTQSGTTIQIGPNRFEVTNMNARSYDKVERSTLQQLETVLQECDELWGYEPTAWRTQRRKV